MGKKPGAILLGIVTIFLLIGPFQPPITDGIKGWRTHNTTETFVVITGAGVTSENVTLDHDLFQSATSEVIAVTSSNATETPAVTSYTESNLHLTLSALDASNTRTITVNYYAETDDTVMRAIGPFLSILIFGGLIFAIMAGVWHEVK